MNWPVYTGSGIMRPTRTRQPVSRHNPSPTRINMPAALESPIIRLHDHSSRRAKRPVPAMEPATSSTQDREANDEATPRFAITEETAVPLSPPHPGERVELIVEYANSLGLRPEVNFD